MFILIKNQEKYLLLKYSIKNVNLLIIVTINKTINKEKQSLVDFYVIRVVERE